MPAPFTPSSQTPSEPKSEVAMDALRLIVIGGFILGGLWVYYLLVDKQSPTAAGVNFGKEFNGLSPAVGACYASYDRFLSIVIAGCFGVALGAAYIFGTFLYKKFRDSSLEERRMFWQGVSNRVEVSSPSEVIELVNGFREYEKLILERRNLYWALFLRAGLALLVVSVIAVLIAECKIESQAGLPIITGIISFIIGQGADALHLTGPSITYVSPTKDGRPSSSNRETAATAATSRNEGAVQQPPIATD